MRIGIDLLWVRVGKCGGTESYIRNLLDGLVLYDRQNEYILFTSHDNRESFAHYPEYPRMKIVECNMKSNFQVLRMLWENLFLDHMAGKEGVETMFIPVYSKPLSSGRIPYICVIHDLQALHYPQYFSLVKRLFLRFAWWHTCKTADRIITISNYCREDLIAKYPFAGKKIRTIYNPVMTRDSVLDAGIIEKRYGIKSNEYFYCVSSMLPHKNLITILRVIHNYVNQGREKVRLVLSGVGGAEEAALKKTIKIMGIERQIIITGFVSNDIRDCLYENCRLFLFPSIFEGFGMPPVEAMRKGRNVVMTEKSCLKEVTKGKAVYVKNPLDVREWTQKIEYALTREPEKAAFEEYELDNVVSQYVNAFHL